MVWVTGFDPATSCTRNTRSTRLSYTQMKESFHCDIAPALLDVEVVFRPKATTR